MNFQAGISRRKTDNWTKLAVFELYGFWFIGRVFTYVGAPLLAVWVFNRALCRRLYTALTRRDVFSGLAWLLLLSIMYGVCEVAYGILSGATPAAALRIFTFNLFPLYLFVGFWAGACRPDLIRGYIRFNAWFITIYTPIYFIFLSKLNSETSQVVPSPGSGSMVLLGLFCFESSFSTFWLPILICTFTMLANEIRADWLGFGIEVIIWGTAAKKLRHVFSIAGILVVLLLIGFVADVRLPALRGRGGEISARDTIGRALSSVDPELAREYSSNAASYAGTVSWRETWWRNIREAVSKNDGTLIFGLGYGYPINELGPVDIRRSDIVTPHSIIYFTLCFSGCAGVLLFFSLQAAILRLLWRAFKETGQIFGFAWYVGMLVAASFGNLFESPQAAIPIYLLAGLCIGPMFQETDRVERRPDWQNVFPARMKMGRFAAGPRTAQEALFPSRLAKDGSAAKL